MEGAVKKFLCFVHAFTLFLISKMSEAAYGAAGTGAR
jgi:hypothetical protein